MSDLVRYKQQESGHRLKRKSRPKAALNFKPKMLDQEMGVYRAKKKEAADRATSGVNRRSSS